MYKNNHTIYLFDLPKEKNISVEIAKAFKRYAGIILDHQPEILDFNGYCLLL
jgi:hypothetical protein